MLYKYEKKNNLLFSLLVETSRIYTHGFFSWYRRSFIERVSVRRQLVYGLPYGVDPIHRFI